MRHLSEEELVEIFYAGANDHEHFKECPDCRGRFEDWKHTLERWPHYDAPERSESYGREVWARISPLLEKRRRRTFRLWAVPALAVMLAAAFVLGLWTERRRTEGMERARERVLLLAMSDHLERSQILLTQLLHADPASFETATERERARELLMQNRLLRVSAREAGDRQQAAVLEELERVFLLLANGQTDDMKLIQERVMDDELLWKVRITSSNAHNRGQKL